MMTHHKGNPENRGAIGNRVSIISHCQNYGFYHWNSLRQSFHAMGSQPLQTTMTVAVIAIALTLPTMLYLAVENIARLGDNLEASSQITVFTKKTATERDIATLKQQLQAMPEVKTVQYVPADQALLEFKAISGLGSAIQHLDDNPLPAVLLVEPGTLHKINLAWATEFIKKINSLDHVDDSQIDMVWLQRLRSLIEIGRKIVLVLGLILNLGVLLIVSNTIRLAIQNRRDEIIIIKFVGGTNAYVRRPFLYNGMLLGLSGALVAWMILIICLKWLNKSVEVLVSAYQSQYHLVGLGYSELIALTGFGGAIGLFGALVAVSRLLQDIKPH